MSLLLHYEKIAKFNKEFYKNLLTHEHVEGGQIQLNKLIYPDGGVDDQANFWGYKLVKDGKKYLVESTSKNGKEIHINKLLPILPTALDKVAHQKEVFFHVSSYSPARFRAEKKMTFRELVNALCEASHTNKKHHLLLCMSVMAQMMSRANFRFCSPAGFGKNSIVGIVGNLMNGASVITNPTRAKLEFRTTNKLLYVDEVVNIKKAEWERIEPFLLATGDHSPTVEKQSRAFKGVGEVLDISDFSLGLFYNDIDHYPDPEKYFDFVPNKALLDRFPAMRLYGVFDEDFNSVKKENVTKFVKDNMDRYKDIIYTFTYFKEHLEDELARYDDTLLNKDLPKRWLTNLNVLTKMIDLYSENQTEFSGWMTVINESIYDYQAMLDYPMYLEAAKKKLPKKDWPALTKTLKNLDTFSERNDKLKQVHQTGRLEEPLGDTMKW